jgi:hypothetical protein
VGVCASTVLVTGEAFAPTLASLLANTSYNDTCTVLPIRNDFFGGNVNVTGLLTAQDIVAQIQACHPVLDTGTVGAVLTARPQSGRTTPPRILIPNVIFNADGLTLDDKTAAWIAEQLQCPVQVVDCNATNLLTALTN